MSAILELCQIKSGSSGNSDVVQNDGRATALVLDGRSSIGKGAALSRLDGRMGKS